jgi:hypothetical protein
MICSSSTRSKVCGRSEAVWQASDECLRRSDAFIHDVQLLHQKRIRSKVCRRSEVTCEVSWRDEFMRPSDDFIPIEMRGRHAGFQKKRQ